MAKLKPIASPVEITFLNVFLNLNRDGICKKINKKKNVECESTGKNKDFNKSQSLWYKLRN